MRKDFGEGDAANCTQGYSSITGASSESDKLKKQADELRAKIAREKQGIVRKSLPFCEEEGD